MREKIENVSTEEFIERFRNYSPVSEALKKAIEELSCTVDLVLSPFVQDLISNFIISEAKVLHHIENFDMMETYLDAIEQNKPDMSIPSTRWIDLNSPLALMEWNVFTNIKENYFKDIVPDSVYSQMRHFHVSDSKITEIQERFRKQTFDLVYEEYWKLFKKHLIIIARKLVPFVRENYILPNEEVKN